MSSAADPDDNVERLNVRVPPAVKDSFEAAVAEKYGSAVGFARYELVRELRLRLDVGIEAEVNSAIGDLADVYGQTDREKKFLNTPDGRGSVVAYRVPTSIRKGLHRLANDADRGIGEYVASVMQRYAKGEGVDERNLNNLDRIKAATDYKFDDGLSAKERRTKAIADRLGTEFSIDEFGEAIDATAEPISDTRYTREEYLPRVLDETGCTWHPSSSELFIDADDVDADERRDRRSKPYLLMDDADKRLALKMEAYSNATRLTVSEAVSTLQGKPQRTTAKQLLRDIGDTDGFKYRRGADRRKTNADDLLLLTDHQQIESSEDHKELRRILDDQADGETADQTDDHRDDIETETDDDQTDAVEDRGEAGIETGDQWVSEAADELPDVSIDTLPDTVIRNKVAEATNDQIERDGSGAIEDEYLEAVNDDQVTAVREYLDDGDDVDAEEPQSPPSKGGGNTAKTGTQQPEADADERLDALNSASAVKTDGGRPTDQPD